MSGRCGCRACDPAAWPESNGWVCQPQRENARLRQQVADLEADRKRLDLIERKKLRVTPYGHRWFTIYRYPRMDGSHVREGRTLREAIDGWLKEAE